MLHHDKYLTVAIEEAERAFHKDDYPVGAILVDNRGEIIARSQNTMYSKGGPANHAEIALLLSNQAYLAENEWKVSLYSSLEPCTMCLGAAIISRISHIVWAAHDYWAGAMRSYNFDSSYLRSRPCILVPPSSISLRKRSVVLIARHLEKNSPEHLYKILGEEQVNMARENIKNS